MDWIDWKSMVFQFAGTGIFVLGVIFGFRQAGAADDAKFWVFLNFALIPMALGILIMVAADIADRLGNKNN